MSNEERPELTPRARELLEEYKKDVTRRILNEAEKHVLGEKRKEIGEADISRAQKIIPVGKFSSLRKWIIRVLIFVTFALLVLQLEAFSELPVLPIATMVWVIFPTLAVLFLMIVFTFIFKEDWL